MTPFRFSPILSKSLIGSGAFNDKLGVSWGSGGEAEVHQCGCGQGRFRGEASDAAGAAVTKGVSHGDWVELVVSSAGKQIVLVPLMYIFVMILKAPFRSIFGQLSHLMSSRIFKMCWCLQNWCCGHWYLLSHPSWSHRALQEANNLVGNMTNHHALGQAEALLQPHSNAMIEVAWTWKIHSPV